MIQAYIPPPKGPNLNDLAHRLVITGDSHEEREYEVIHPSECPVACFWSPFSRDAFYESRAEAILDPSPWAAPWRYNMAADEQRDPGGRTCYVQYEIEGNGLDSLDIWTADEEIEFDPPDPVSRWAPVWRRLRPGEYRIQGWFTPFQWAGSEPIDADGGLILLGRA